MTVADGSQTRLAFIAEATPGTIPSTPTWQVMRYVSENIRLAKQTAVPDEIVDHRNVTDIVDVGRMVEGTINTLLSYGTFDVWLSHLMCADWSSDVLKNGKLHKTGVLEKTFEQGATDSYIRYRGSRFNTLDLALAPRQFVTANWGVIGIGSPTPTTAIISGATYTAATTTPVLNAALNVASLAMTGIAATPKIQALNLRINNNIYANDIIGQYEPDSHGLGRFDVTGSMTTLFTDLALYEAILDHDDLTLGFTIGAATGEKYTVALPKIKALDGGPVVGGNNRAVIMEVPIQAKYDGSSAASISITREVA